MSSPAPEQDAASDDPTPEGWEAGDREYPYWDERIESLVYAHHGPWLVSVTPMMFNDRVLLTSRTGYPRQWTAGFCYDKGPAAGLAAMAWNPETQPRPVGYKKVAADSRFTDDEAEV